MLTPIDLPDEGFDRGFKTAAGRIFRAKVAKTAQSIEARALEQAAANRVTMMISVSLLNDDLTVSELAGGYRIFEPVEVTIGDDELSNPDFDLAVIIQGRIENRIEMAERVLDAQEKAAADMAAWGISLA